MLILNEQIEIMNTFVASVLDKLKKAVQSFINSPGMQQLIKILGRINSRVKDRPEYLSNRMKSPLPPMVLKHQVVNRMPLLIRARSYCRLLITARH